MSSKPNISHTAVDDEVKRRKITQYCLKSSSLEGIELDKEALDQFDLLDSGKITMDDFIARMLKRVGKDPQARTNDKSI